MSDLTDAQIDAMPAGREMDTEVAIRVMGFRWAKTNNAEFPHRFLAPPDPQYWTARPWLVLADGSEEESRHAYSNISCYSEDIAAAWEVVNHFSRTYHWRICSPFTLGEPWVAGFTPHGTTGWNGVPDVQATGETAEHAISRAALKATLRSREAGG